MSFLQVNSSGAPKPWGKLTSINVNLKNIDLVAPAYKIGRNSTNDIPISDVRISGNHCILTRADNGSVTIQDLSSNGTFIEDQKIGKGKSKLLMPGNKFTLLPTNKIPEKDLLGYVFSLSNYHTSPIKRQREEGIEESKIQNTKQIKPPASPTKEELDKNKCLLCNDYLYQCITTIPCRHSFCGACYCSSVGVLPTCPECFNEVKELQRNKTVDENVQKFWEKYPQFKRKPEDLLDMNKRNKFQSGHVFSDKPENPKPQQQQRQEQPVVSQQNTPQQRQQQQPPKESKLNVSQSRSPATSTVNVSMESIKDSKSMPKIQRYHLLMSKFTAE